jgi:hypothetical protein
VTFDPEVAEADLLRAAGVGVGPRLGIGHGAGPDLGGIPMRVVGIGWATVELDRAATELASIAGGDIARAERDTLLGATARIRPGSGAGPAVILLEPFTEGRLAAFLARHGEGPAVLYLAPGQAGLESTVDRLAAAGIRTRVGIGPLGRAALVLGRPADEPQLVLVAVPSQP